MWFNHMGQINKPLTTTHTVWRNLMSNVTEKSCAKTTQLQTNGIYYCFCVFYPSWLYWPLLLILHSLISKAEWCSQLLQLHHRSRSQDCQFRMSASTACRLPLTPFHKRAPSLQHLTVLIKQWTSRVHQSLGSLHGYLSVSLEQTHRLLSQV